MFRSVLRHASPHTRCTLPCYRIASINSYRYMARFFAPNEADEKNANIGEEQTAQLSDDFKFSISSQKVSRMLDPNAFYPDVEITDPSIIEDVLEITYEPFKSWKEICHLNLTNPAKAGSFVEFIESDEIHFGVVLREPYTRFNPYHNRMIVLTLHNDLIKVYPQDITFSLYQVLDSESIQAQNILASRYNESFAPRAKLVQALHQFMAIVSKNRDPVAHALRYSHSNLATPGKAAPVCLAELTKFISSRIRTELPSYFHESALLMANYLEMCKDSSRWMIPGLIPTRRTTNLSSSTCSNIIPPPPLIFATSVAIFDDISHFLSLDSKELTEFDSLLESLLRSPKKYDDLVLQFVIWDAKRFKSALRAMMYAVAHPHPQILHKLSTMPIFKSRTATSKSIQTIFKQIGLYDNPQNPLTDPLLTSGILGEVQKHSLIASSIKDLEVSNLSHFALEEAQKSKFADKFPHLRQSRSYFHDTTAYILPGIKPNIAISMEEINSRRFLINIHVADYASRLAPSSATFARWSGTNAFLESVANSQRAGNEHLFPSEAVEKALFTKANSDEQSNFFVAGSLTEQHQRQSNKEKQNCVTITFEYNSYLEDPMKSISDTASISFDSLYKFQLKTLKSEVLEGSLTGKLEPSIFNKLKLFRQREPLPESDKPLKPEDHYNLNFIYNAFRRHFEARNRKYAVSLAPSSRPKSVIKTLTALKDTDAIQTQLSLVSEKFLLEKSEFLRSEAEILAGRLVGAYADKNSIPVFYDTQELLNEEEVGKTSRDEVLIRHDNALLPDFSASSYTQVAYGRDVSGHVTTPAFKFASNFLGLQVTGTNSKHASSALGLRNGIVNVVDATESMKAYINQLQILQHVHFTRTANAQLFNEARAFSYLKALGYSLHGALSKPTIDAYCDRLAASSMGANYLTMRQRKYWVLKTVEQNPHHFKDLSCVVTQYSRDIEISIDSSWTEKLETGPNLERDEITVPTSSRLQMVRAYSEELGIEVSLLVDPSHAISVGSEKIASEVVYVDPVSEIIVLR